MKAAPSFIDKEKKPKACDLEQKICLCEGRVEGHGGQGIDLNVLDARDTHSMRRCMVKSFRNPR
jgi:hypothetical protein